MNLECFSSLAVKFSVKSVLRYSSVVCRFDIVQCSVFSFSIKQYIFTMAGRVKNKAYDELDYDLVRVNNKHAAFCRKCKKNLLNTAEARLRAHR